MALDQAYFEGISLEVVKKKYYNANKVAALLEDIRQKALQQNAENQELRRRLGELCGQKEQIGDALLSARTVSQQMIADANEEADRIVAEAREKADALAAEAARVREEAEKEAARCTAERAERLRSSYHMLRDCLSGCLETIEQDEPLFTGGAPEAPEAPADLSERVDALARELLSIDGE
ncbi:MAG: DivIVA domain-containing protein [Oscillospiraceae bacterium]|nr:DivIVA domain-containing protein [Oscillospiraceae bacterium]